MSLIIIKSIRSLTEDSERGLPCLTLTDCEAGTGHLLCRLETELFTSGHRTRHKPVSLNPGSMTPKLQLGHFYRRPGRDTVKKSVRTSHEQMKSILGTPPFNSALKVIQAVIIRDYNHRGMQNLL